MDPWVSEEKVLINELMPKGALAIRSSFIKLFGETLADSACTIAEFYRIHVSTAALARIPQKLCFFGLGTLPLEVRPRTSA